MHPIQPIILRYLRDELRDGEQAELDAWLAASPANRAFLEEFEDTERVGKVLAHMDSLPEKAAWERMYAYTLQGQGENNDTIGPIRRFRSRWTIAAAVLLLLGTGAWWLLHTRQHLQPVTQTVLVHDVAAPARNQATITLGNGQRVALDSAANGALAQQNNIRVVKQANGQVTYQAAVGPLDHSVVLYNTLTNPRGSQVVSLTLTDGTRVWLNAASSLRYPVAFTGADRTVQITGEAYFEVATDAHHPFYVQKENTVVTVLGTAFNINAYSDEPAIRVTLVEGKVRVTAASQRHTLQPGQQATVTPGATGMEVTPNADLDQILAWKNGAINFNGLSLEQAMRQLERWYDIEVVYERGVPAVHLWGELGRNVSLNSLLKGLEESKLHFRIEEGRRLVVLP